MDSLSSSYYSCPICFEPFGPDNKCPRVLTCGHTFCEFCLKKLLTQSAICSICNERIKFPSVEDFPVNFFANRIAKLFSDYIDEKEKSTDTLPFISRCVEHRDPNYFQCLDCSKDICGVCWKQFHKKCECVLSLEEALKKKKAIAEKEFSKIVDNSTHYLKFINERNTTLGSKIKQYEEELKMTQQIKSAICTEKADIEEFKKNLGDQLIYLKDASCHSAFNNILQQFQSFVMERSFRKIPRDVILEALLNKFPVFVTKDEETCKKISEVNLSNGEITFQCWEKEMKDENQEKKKENEETEGILHCNIIEFLTLFEVEVCTSVITNKIDTTGYINFDVEIITAKTLYGKLSLTDKIFKFHRFSSEASGPTVKFETACKLLNLKMNGDIFIEIEREQKNVTTIGISTRLDMITNYYSSAVCNFFVMSSGMFSESYKGVELKFEKNNFYSRCCGNILQLFVVQCDHPSKQYATNDLYPSYNEYRAEVGIFVSKTNINLGFAVNSINPSEGKICCSRVSPNAIAKLIFPQTLFGIVQAGDLVSDCGFLLENESLTKLKACR